MAEVITFSSRHESLLIQIAMLETSLVNIHFNPNTASQKSPSKHYNKITLLYMSLLCHCVFADD
jgi:hypothetical protein